MKTHNKKPFLLFLSIILLFTFLSISAYTMIFKKSNQTKIEQPKKENFNDGPIQFSSDLDNQYYYDNDHVYLYIDLKAHEGGGRYERTPLNIAIVIDKSGSMSEKNKMNYVKRAVDYVIDQLESEDYVSIVTFDDNTNVLQRSA